MCFNKISFRAYAASFAINKAQGMQSIAFERSVTTSNRKLSSIFSLHSIALINSNVVYHKTFCKLDLPAEYILFSFSDPLSVREKETTFAPSRNIPVAKLLLTASHKGLERVAADFVTSVGRILSIPVALSSMFLRSF